MNEFVYGYVDGEQVMIANTVEQVCAFIMKYKYESVKITNFFDELLIETSMGFIMYCRDQTYLANNLLPTLAPMQMGDTEIPEFVPYKEKEESNEMDDQEDSKWVQNELGNYLSFHIMIPYFNDQYPKYHVLKKSEHDEWVIGVFYKMIGEYVPLEDEGEEQLVFDTAEKAISYVDIELEDNRHSSLMKIKEAEIINTGGNCMVLLMSVSNGGNIRSIAISSDSIGAYEVEDPFEVDDMGEVTLWFTDSWKELEKKTSITFATECRQYFENHWNFEHVLKD
ncbi:hypothetical protein AWM68_17540 [Fictibacillus phosphorivorans]|uniref:Uncharacterized protein n=1 Tax=Fictibacillus phosphorivorans TaxID=1221500 RepID=A0A165NWQ4_9BACL|nr:hypothetical protein [Fictibacillus phosphorivorans]KZE67975.1 hypothetical protein AWM68_17540 [Fictibacillus phosphorivorans]